MRAIAAKPRQFVRAVDRAADPTEPILSSRQAMPNAADPALAAINRHRSAYQVRAAHCQ